MAEASADTGTLPVAIVCIGMAGSGKTTFMQRINAHLHAQRGSQPPPYVLNLDPAVLKVPFEPNIDIRDSVNYKEVMRQYRLGPNGGILTALNLFATKTDQVMGLLEKRASPAKENQAESSAQLEPIKHILIDTPGQIEVFVWSASGAILLESLASSFPTVIAYIVDTPRTASPATFMSNMLYACSILYKTKLPMILVFNKTDVKDASFAREWMTDFEAFQKALNRDEEAQERGGVGGTGYMGSLLNSMSLVLEEFYSHLNAVSVSSRVGMGIDEFFRAVENKRREFMRDYYPELQRRRQQREEEKNKAREQEVGKMMRDLSMDQGQSTATGKVENAESASDDAADVDMDVEDDVAGNTNEGLQARYKASMNEDRSVMADASFTNYVHGQK